MKPGKLSIEMCEVSIFSWCWLLIKGKTGSWHRAEEGVGLVSVKKEGRGGWGFEVVVDEKGRLIGKPTCVRAGIERGIQVVKGWESSE